MSTEHTLAVPTGLDGVRATLPVRVVERRSPPPPPAPPDLGPLVEAARAQGAALRQAIEEQLGDWEQACVELCVEAVERLLGRELSAAPAELEQTLRQIAEESRALLEDATVVVHVHPREAERLAPALLEDEALHGFELRPDPKLEPGDLRLQTEHGAIVHRLSDELRRVQRAWREELRS